MEFETLQTERLLLKKITPEIIAYILGHYSDAEIKKIFGHTSDAELETEKRKSIGGYQTYDRTMVSFLLESKATGEILGRCGFHNWYADHAKAEIGYALLKDDFKRQGFMTEAVEAILQYGFETLKINRIEACVGPENQAPLAIIRKNGFTQEGHLRQHYCRDGVTQDSLVFSLLCREFYNL